MAKKRFRRWLLTYTVDSYTIYVLLTVPGILGRLPCISASFHGSPTLSNLLLPGLPPQNLPPQDLPPQDLALCLALVGWALQCLALLSSALKGFALLGLIQTALLGLALPGSARLGLARLGSARLGSARLDSARLGLARLGSARLGLARLGSARLGSVLLGSALPGLAPSGLAPSGLSQAMDAAFAGKCKWRVFFSQQPFLIVGGFNNFNRTLSSWCHLLKIKIERKYKLKQWKSAAVFWIQPWYVVLLPKYLVLSRQLFAASTPSPKKQRYLSLHRRLQEFNQRPKVTKRNRFSLNFSQTDLDPLGDLTECHVNTWAPSIYPVFLAISKLLSLPVWPWCAPYFPSQP